MKALVLFMMCGVLLSASTIHSLDMEHREPVYIPADRHFFHFTNGFEEPLFDGVPRDLVFYISEPAENNTRPITTVRVVVTPEPYTGLLFGIAGIMLFALGQLKRRSV